MVSRSCFSSEGCWGLCLPTPPSSGWGPHLPLGHGCPQPPSFCPRGRLPLSAGRPCGCGSFPEVSPLLEAVLAQLSRACPGTCPSPSPIHTGLRRATAGAGGHKPDGGKLRQASLPAQDLILTPHLLVRSSRAPSAHRARLPAPAPLVGDPGPKPSRAVASRSPLICVSRLLLRRGPRPRCGARGRPRRGWPWPCVGVQDAAAGLRPGRIRTGQGSMWHLQCCEEGFKCLQTTAGTKAGAGTG